MIGRMLIILVLMFSCSIAWGNYNDPCINCECGSHGDMYLICNACAGNGYGNTCNCNGSKTNDIAIVEVNTEIEKLRKEIELLKEKIEKMEIASRKFAEKVRLYILECAKLDKIIEQCN